MSTDRRDFLRQASALAAAIGLGGCATTPNDPPRAELPLERTRAMMERFGLSRPIFQSGMGGVRSPDLCIAVSNAGGMGSISCTNATPERVREIVASVMAGTSRPFSVNYLLPFDLTTLDVALEAGAPVVQFAFGLPTIEQAKSITSARRLLGIQIASAEGAQRALDLGADFLICQGMEAGGHVQAAAPLYELLPRVLAVSGSTPVLAAGGLSTGAHMRRALLAGADGIFMGTRFLATRESDAHDIYKAALIRSGASDTAFTTCFQDGWPNASHRVLRTSTFIAWEAAGCPPAGKRPGEGDVVATTFRGTPIARYRTHAPHLGMTGNLSELAFYSGTGVGEIRDLPGAGEVVDRLWRECLASA